MPEYYVFTRKWDEDSGWMNGCIVWWRPEGKGCTYDLDHAGIFTEKDMERRYPDPVRCCYVPKEIVDSQCQTFRLAWWRNPDHPSVEQAIKEVA